MNIIEINDYNPTTVESLPNSEKLLRNYAPGKPSILNRVEHIMH